MGSDDESSAKDDEVEDVGEGEARECTATVEELGTAPTGSVVATLGAELGNPASGSGDIPRPAPAVPSTDTDDDGDGGKLWYLCLYKCGPRRPRGMFIPKGRQGSAVMVCHPCYNALKALEYSHGKTEKSKQLLSKFRKGPDAFAALIRRTRIKVSHNEIGLDSLAERRKAFIEARSLMQQFLEISETWTALWLTEKRYIAHQIFVEGIEGDTLGECRKAARLKWKEEIKNKRTRTRNGELELHATRHQQSWPLGGDGLRRKYRALGACKQWHN